MGDHRQELIRDLWDRWNHGDREIDSAEIHPDAAINSAMTVATYLGHAGIKDWMAEIDEQFESWQISIEEITDVPGARVLATGKVRFRGRASGIEFDQPIGWLVRFDGERVIELTNFADHESARDAAGLGA